VFKQLLGRAYLGKLENYAGEQIVYVGETVDGDFATVRSKIVTARGAEIPVDYRLHLVNSRWAVYDVAVQGVSFVANYRGQFDRIIRTSSYPSLMRDLRAKYAQATSRTTVGGMPSPAAPAPAVPVPAAVAVPAAAPAPKPQE
jgi:phospholipid transport system substrate-binding protein